MRMPVDMELLLFRRMLQATLAPAVGADHLLHFLASLSACSPAEPMRRAVATLIGRAKNYATLAVLRKLEPPAAVKLMLSSPARSVFDDSRLYQMPEIQLLVPLEWREYRSDFGSSWYQRLDVPQSAGRLSSLAAGTSPTSSPPQSPRPSGGSGASSSPRAVPITTTAATASSSISSGTSLPTSPRGNNNAGPTSPRSNNNAALPTSPRAIAVPTSPRSNNNAALPTSPRAIAVPTSPRAIPTPPRPQSAHSARAPPRAALSPPRQVPAKPLPPVPIPSTSAPAAASTIASRHQLGDKAAPLASNGNSPTTTTPTTESVPEATTTTIVSPRTSPQTNPPALSTNKSSTARVELVAMSSKRQSGERTDEECLVTGKRNKLRRAGEALHHQLAEYSVLPQLARDLEHSGGREAEQSIAPLVEMFEESTRLVAADIQIIMEAKAQLACGLLQLDAQVHEKQQYLTQLEQVQGDLEEARVQTLIAIDRAKQHSTIASAERGRYSSERRLVDVSIAMAESKQLAHVALVLSDFFGRIRAQQRLTNAAFVASFNHDYIAGLAHTVRLTTDALGAIEAEIKNKMPLSNAGDAPRIASLEQTAHTIGTKCLELDGRIAEFQLNSSINVSAGMLEHDRGCTRTNSLTHTTVIVVVVMVYRRHDHRGLQQPRETA